MRKTFKRGLVAVMLPAVMLMSVACGDESKSENDTKDNNSTISSEETSGKETSSDVGNDEKVDKPENDVIDEPSSKKEVGFSDFLVERCVRKELNKNWDESITVEELETITSLVIDSSYDPTFMSGLEVPRELDNASYIDLIDIKYLTNLEELMIDAYDGTDTVVNVESIKNCKKLKKISIPCAQSVNGATKSLNRLGYSYWADIIAELPNLEYIDLGMYLDEHMKEVVLAKAANKDIEIYEGPLRGGRDAGIYKEFSSGYRITHSMCYPVSDPSQYAKEWTHEYMGIGNAYIKNFNTITRKLEVFPYIQVENQAELVNALKAIDKDIEDIIIVINNPCEVDFSIFEEFDNLVSLTVYNKGFSREKEEVWNEEVGVLEYILGEALGTKAVNLDKLASLKNLQVINFGGFIGDLSDMAKLSKLREVSIVDSCIDSVDFIGELKQCKELTLGLICYDDELEKQLDKKLDEEVCSLSELKMYRDQNNLSEEIEYFSNIENMKSLETLFTYLNDDQEKSLVNISDSVSLKNLRLYYRVNEATIYNVSFDKMKSLETLHIDGFVRGEYDFENILKVENLVSVRLPLVIDEETMDNIYTSKTVNMIKNHGKISAFCFSVERAYAEIAYNGVDRNNIKELYELGIEDGIYRQWAYTNANTETIAVLSAREEEEKKAQDEAIKKEQEEAKKAREEIEKTREEIRKKREEEAKKKEEEDKKDDDGDGGSTGPEITDDTLYKENGIDFF